MSKRRDAWLVRIICISILSGIFAAFWDANIWHSILGRESFFQLPHNILYLSIAAALFTSLYAWYHDRQYWRRITMVIVLLPVSALLDNLWHIAFGTEPLRSLIIYWSPPHIATELMLASGLIMLLSVIREKETNINWQIFLVSAVFVCLNAILCVFLWPLRASGVFQVIGSTGAIAEPILITVQILAIQKLLPQYRAATFFTVALAAFTFLAHLVAALQFDYTEIPHDIWIRYTGPYIHPPLFLQSLVLIIAGLAADSLKHVSEWKRGFVIGLITGIGLYVVGFNILGQRIHSTSGQTIYMGFASIVACTVAAHLYYLVRKGNYSEKYSQRILQFPLIFMSGCFAVLLFAFLYMSFVAQFPVV